MRITQTSFVTNQKKIMIIVINSRFQSPFFPPLISRHPNIYYNALAILLLLFWQERGNVRYVVRNGCGKFSKSPKEIAEIVRDWFGPKAEEFKAMSQKALDLARPDAAFDIVNDLHKFVSEGNDEKK